MKEPLQNLMKPKKQTISVGTNTFSVGPNTFSVGTDTPLFPELNGLPVLGNGDDESEDEEFKEEYVSEDEEDLPFLDEDEYELEGVTDEIKTC